MDDGLSSTRHKYAISKQLISDNSSHVLRVGYDK